MVKASSPRGRFALSAPLVLLGLACSDAGTEPERVLLRSELARPHLVPAGMPGSECPDVSPSFSGLIDDFDDSGRVARREQRHGYDLGASGGTGS
jgi:hypothetical protein